jgi:hypothetical protein
MNCSLRVFIYIIDVHLCNIIYTSSIIILYVIRCTLDANSIIIICLLAVFNYYPNNWFNVLLIVKKWLYIRTRALLGIYLYTRYSYVICNNTSISIPTIIDNYCVALFFTFSDPICTIYVSWIISVSLCFIYRIIIL